MNIEYKKFLNESMLEFIKKVLARIQHENLYWDQLIYISYKTDHPAVILPLKVRQAYPKEITIVLQNQFENIIVKDTGFSVMLSFSGIKETIYIPFDALIIFVDSSNSYSFTFNQQLNIQNNSTAEILKIEKQILKEENNDKIDEALLSKNVIMLDKFRNSPSLNLVKILKENISKVVIYTDGACSGNPGPGGWGALLQFNKLNKEIFGHELETTNNRMEITAALEALKILKKPCHVEIYTDSKYLQQGITVWIHNWIKNNWCKSNNEPVKNADLWQNLYEELSKHTIIWKWVKGHASNSGNIAADKLAVQGRQTAIEILKCRG